MKYYKEIARVHSILRRPGTSVTNGGLVNE